MEEKNEFILKDIMKFSHDLDEFLKGLNMFKGLSRDIETRTIQKNKTMD